MPHDLNANYTFIAVEVPQRRHRTVNYRVDYQFNTCLKFAIITLHSIRVQKCVITC